MSQHEPNSAFVLDVPFDLEADDWKIILMLSQKKFNYRSFPHRERIMVTSMNDRLFCIITATKKRFANV